MNLNLFENLKKDIGDNISIKNFMKDLVNSLNNTKSNKAKNTNNTSNEKAIKTDKEWKVIETILDTLQEEVRKKANNNEQ